MALQRGLRLLYVCRSLDDDDSDTGVQATWVRTLAGHPDVDHVHVLSRGPVRAPLPENVTAVSFGQGRGAPVRFVREVLRAPRPWPDAFLVTQGGAWSLLLKPFALFTRRRLHRWLAQPTLSRGSKLVVRWCDDIVFTPTSRSLPSMPHVRVTGHGIDASRFVPTDRPPERDVVIVGRIAPSKRVEAAIAAVVDARMPDGRPPTLDVVGGGSRAGRAYREKLEARVNAADVASRVSFAGRVPYGEMPARIVHYRLMLNLSHNALDKVVVEAMAAGVPVISTNPCVAEVLPPDLRALLYVDESDHAGLVDRIERVLSLTEPERRELCARVRDVAVREHSVGHLFDQIVATIRSG